MRKETIDIIGDLIAVAIGLWFMTGYRSLGQRTSDYNFRLLNIRYSVRGYQFGFLIAGICFLALGLLSLLGVFRTQ